MYIPNFKYYKPKTIHQAASFLDECSNGAILAGGTDILVEIKNQVRSIDELVSISEIPDLKIISEENDFISIGSNLTHNEISKYDLIRKYCPALAEAALKIGSHQIRNVGTIGGNLCTGASCADTAPVLISYDSKIELVSSNNSRIIPLKDFLIFHHKTDLKKNEILSRIIVPKKKTNSAASFEKFGLREASSISVASVSVNISFESNICNSVNIVIGACSPVPIISLSANNLILNKNINELVENSEILIEAGNAASQDTMPIDDLRASANYRKNLVKILTKRALIKSINRIKIN